MKDPVACKQMSVVLAMLEIEFSAAAASIAWLNVVQVFSRLDSLGVQRCQTACQAWGSSSSGKRSQI